MDERWGSRQIGENGLRTPSRQLANRLGAALSNPLIWAPAPLVAELPEPINLIDTVGENRTYIPSGMGL